MKNVHIVIRFTDPILGMSPADPDVYVNFIASKAPKDQDVSDELPDNSSANATGVTIFPRTQDGQPCFFDYQVSDAAPLTPKFEIEYTTSV